MKIPFYFTRIGQAASSFARARADWYEYLADMTEDTQGRRTFLSILEADAQRYGKSARGVLSAYWAHRIVETGELGRTLHRTLPPREVAEFVSLQTQGQAVFAGGLRDMAAVVRVTAKLRSILVGTLAVAALLLLLVWAMVMVAVPYLTAPMLQDAMPDIRFELLSPSTQAFFDMAQWIRDKGVRLWLVSIALGVAVYLSFPYMDNPLRRWLDKWGPYRLYRDVQAIAVVSTAATAVKPRAGKVMQIRQAIELQLPGASRWLSRRLQAIQNRLDDAKKGAAIFDVGLLDREIYWYLEDLTNTLGLDAGLQKTRARMETTILKRVEDRAKVLRWVALICAVLVMAGLFFWHQSVIMDMRNALMIDAM
ncbi:hypothetical protein ASE30_18820 [Achromobacter sp. Root83]|uniref:hypothetical protein n=1 Tax=Achromobacter sp. Root83 TaxID=1736602 RepID=UPI0007106D71|nr:hypothetical protein [Achromobacter sp. Root83]KRC69277.1 hypothetical protein ASE30_18820 [Achromobacter sp. Root83]